MTKSFVEYLKSQPMVFEVFGHYQHLQPVGHSAALIGSLQQGQNKNVTTKEGSVSRQSTLTATNPVITEFDLFFPFLLQ